jgi:hypothetical protein
MARSKNSFMSRDRQGRLNSIRARERRERLDEIRGAERQSRIRQIVRGRDRRRRDRQAIPGYEVDVTRVNGNIHTITVRPISTGETNYSMPLAQRTVANLLRIFTRDEVANATGWSLRTTMNRIHGFTQVTNILNPTSTQFYTIDNLRDINQEKVDEIFENMQQSETEVPFEHLEFMVVIDPTSYQTGAGTELSVKRGKGLGWETYYDDQGPINCAAVAITLLTKKERFDQKKPLLKK